ncbi:MAG: hypothetical protein ACW986_15725 [Promethearchaeota archaeon]
MTHQYNQKVKEDDQKAEYYTVFHRSAACRHHGLCWRSGSPNTEPR